MIARFLNQSSLTTASQEDIQSVSNGGVSALRGPRAYLFASLVTGAAFLLRSAFDQIWTDRLAYAWFFLALIVVARFASRGPQLFTLIAGLLLGNWFFIQPRASLRIESPVDQINTFIFCAVSSFVIFGSSRLRQRLLREFAARDRIAGILECTSDAVCTVNADWIITYFNKRATQLAALNSSDVLGRHFWTLWPRLVGTRFEFEYRGVMAHREPVSFEEFYAPKNRWIEVSACPYGDGIAIFFRDVTERRQQHAERERLIGQLQSALAEVKTLSGLLPICAQCKKIRDDRGYWKQIETFISERSSAKFSHGICPTCFVHLYPDIDCSQSHS